MSNELSKYISQLGQVQKALESDPSNPNLIKLADDLQSVISLSESLALPLGNEGKTVEGEAVAGLQWRLGDSCEAKYSADGQWYPARITSITADRSKFTISYPGYNEVAIVRPNDLRPAQLFKSVAQPATGKKREGPKKGLEAGNEKKKKTKAEYLQDKEKEQAERQHVWKSFTKKSGETGKALRNVFSKPEGNVDGVRPNQKRTRHIFPSSDPNED